jgi:hypothetical protein
MAMSANLDKQVPLRILPMRFVLRSGGMKFSGFSGSVWHGGLGMVLARQSPTAFGLLYQSNPESRLYALLPPMNSYIPAAETFELRVTLFGPGVDYALAIAQAIAELGRVGMRPGGNYQVLAAYWARPEGDAIFLSEQDGFIALPGAYAVRDYLSVTQPVVTACRASLVSPLRIKDGNDLLRVAPGYAQLLRRIFGRLDQLAHVAGEATPLAKSGRDALYEEAALVKTEASSVSAHGIQRRSARSGQQMQFNGLIGSIDYAGEIEHTLPWLRLACITQLGGKTAFGFGGLKIQSGIDCVE